MSNRSATRPAVLMICSATAAAVFLFSLANTDRIVGHSQESLRAANRLALECHTSRTGDAGLIVGDEQETDNGYVEPLVAPLVVDRLLVDNRRTDSFAEFEHDSRATFHPHGQQVCATGCAVSSHPTETLGRETFRKLIAEYSRQPVSSDSAALDALLFYGQQTRDLLQAETMISLGEQHRRCLESELSKTNVLVSLRIVDEPGIVRASNSRIRVPMHRRHVFSLAGNDLQPLIASGTVKRVGRDRLWTRL